MRSTFLTRILRFPISMFVAIGFEHSVTNMFILPAGLLLGGQGVCGGREEGNWKKQYVQAGCHLPFGCSLESWSDTVWIDRNAPAFAAEKGPSASLLVKSARRSLGSVSYAFSLSIVCEIHLLNQAKLTIEMGIRLCCGSKFRRPFFCDGDSQQEPHPGDDWQCNCRCLGGRCQHVLLLRSFGEALA